MRDVFKPLAKLIKTILFDTKWELVNCNLNSHAPYRKGFLESDDATKTAFVYILLLWDLAPAKMQRWKTCQGSQGNITFLISHNLNILQLLNLLLTCNAARGTSGSSSSCRSGQDLSHLAPATVCELCPNQLTVPALNLHLSSLAALATGTDDVHERQCQPPTWPGSVSAG